ncbi:TetR/AcrR family transcriptional regulator [Novosphingobium panipatense]
MDNSLTGLKREAPTDARQVRSRNALTSALLALLEEKPFDQLTIREITARAGTGYATFFRHYPTKEALLADVAAHEIEDLLARAIPALYAANSFESTLELCRHVHEHAMLWSALLTGGAAGSSGRSSSARRSASPPLRLPLMSGCRRTWARSTALVLR